MSKCCNSIKAFYGVDRSTVVYSNWWKELDITVHECLYTQVPMSYIIDVGCWSWVVAERDRIDADVTRIIDKRKHEWRLTLKRQALGTFDFSKDRAMLVLKETRLVGDEFGTNESAANWLEFKRVFNSIDVIKSKVAKYRSSNTLVWTRAYAPIWVVVYTDDYKMKAWKAICMNSEEDKSWRRGRNSEEEKSRGRLRGREIMR